MEITDEAIGLLFGALADQLHALGSRVEIVVIGGSALTALGLVRRATRDVDVLAIADNGEQRLAEPLPQALLAARANVAADFGLAENWLNAGPTDLLKRNISDVLTSLAASRVIKAAWAGNERRFTSCRERWALLLDLAGPGMPSFVSWVHLLPAALQIIMWLDEKADTAESEYLIASQARSLMNRLTRDLEAAGVDIQHRQPAHGTAYLPVFAETSHALLARLRRSLAPEWVICTQPRAAVLLATGRTYLAVGASS